MSIATELRHERVQALAELLRDCHEPRPVDRVRWLRRYRADSKWIRGRSENAVQIDISRFGL